MAQSRSEYENQMKKKQQRIVSEKQAREEREKMLKEAKPIMVGDVDIKHCLGCNADKLVIDKTEMVNEKEVVTAISCSSYPLSGQARWMRLGYCPLGNSGHKPPVEKDEHGKVRAGQQKQKKG